VSVQLSFSGAPMSMRAQKSICCSWTWVAVYDVIVLLS